MFAPLGVEKIEFFLDLDYPPGYGGQRDYASIPMLRVAFVACVGAAVLMSTPVVAKDLGQFEHWNGQSFTVDKQLVCSMWSQPQVDEGKYKRRGDIFVWITHRPAQKTENRISFEMGYPIKPGIQLEVLIDKERFSLFTDGSTAWNLDKANDLKMVKAMRAGKQMEVKGTSKRGTNTRDVYSLSGFTAAHRAIGNACKVAS